VSLQGPAKLVQPRGAHLRCNHLFQTAGQKYFVTLWGAHFA
jgi:hypothetical protein